MKSLPELEAEIAYTTGEIAILKRLKIALEMQMEKRCQNAQLLLHGSEELKKDFEKKQKISVEVSMTLDIASLNRTRRQRLARKC